MSNGVFEWSDIPGWTCPRLLELYDEWAKALKPGQIFVEVGVAYGRSLAYMAGKADPGVTLIGVDSWLVCMGRNNLGTRHWERIRGSTSARMACLAYLADCEVSDRVELCQGNSTDVAYALDFEIDAVFLDGSHEYDAVKKDIQAWTRRVKSGGLVAGHDINDHYPGVEQAVRELCPGWVKRTAVEEGGWGGVWTWRKP